MKLSINYHSGMILIGKNPYNLQDLKKFLISNYPGLVQKFYIRTVFVTGYSSDEQVVRIGDSLYIEKNIYRHGKTVFTYDWKEILRRAENTILPLYEFISTRELVRAGGLLS